MLMAFVRGAAAGGGGGGGPSALGTGGVASTNAPAGVNASATLTFLADGSIQKTGGGTSNNSSGSTQWLSAVGAGNGTPFWTRATLVSGSLSSGVTGAWQQMNSNRLWNLGPATSGDVSAVLTIETATDAGGANIVASGTWTVGYSHTAGSIGSPALSNKNVGGESFVNVKWNSDGTLTIDPGSGAVVYGGEWMSGSGATAAQCSAYELVLTYVSGANTQSGTNNSGGARKTGAPYGTALNLGTQQSIQLAAFQGLVTGSGAGTLVFDAIIRPAGGGATLASARYTLSASVG